MTTLLSKGILREESADKVQAFDPPAHELQNLTSSAKAKARTPGKTAANGKNASKNSGNRISRILSESDAILDKAGEEAELLLARAREEAGSILEEAREEAVRLKKEAFDEGVRNGYADGLEKGRAQAAEDAKEIRRQQQEDFRRGMEEALAAVEAAKNRCVRDYLDELKDCSIAVAEKVIHISLNSSGDVIRRMILAETEKLKKTAWVKIYMAKTDYEAMIETDADVVSELSRLSDNVKFIVMEKEERGSCIIEMPNEIIDISVDTQLENIKDIVQNIRF